MSFADYGFAIWETFYVTVLSTAFSLVLGLPLGVLLVAGDKDGVLPLSGLADAHSNIVINILRMRAVPDFDDLRLPADPCHCGHHRRHQGHHRSAGGRGFPFVARLVETSLRELDEGVVEAAQSMGATPFQIITKVMIPSVCPASFPA